MLAGAVAVLSIAVALGLWLAGTHPADRGGFAHWPVVHGLAGAAGFVLVLVGWRRALLGGPFATDAVLLIGGGLLMGLGVALLGWRRRRVPLAVILVHAALGGIGYLIVAGFAFG